MILTRRGDGCGGGGLGEMESDGELHGLFVVVAVVFGLERGGGGRGLGSGEELE